MSIIRMECWNSCEHDVMRYSPSSSLLVKLGTNFVVRWFESPEKVVKTKQQIWKTKLQFLLDQFKEYWWSDMGWKYKWIDQTS